MINDNLHTNQAGLNLIRSFESLQTKAYLDAHDRFACGYGHTSAAGPPAVHEGDVWTPEYAEQVLRDDLAREFEKKVRRYVEVPLNENQFSALVSAAYNLSTANFKRLIEISDLNLNVYDKMPEALLQFNKSQGRVLRGLTRRRAQEGALWGTPV